MDKQSAGEPANFAVSSIDRYVWKFEILGKTLYILSLRCIYYIFFVLKFFTYLYLDVNHAYHQPLSIMNEKNLVRILLYLRILLMYFSFLNIFLKLSCIMNGCVCFFLQLTGAGALGVLGIDARDPVEIQLAVGIAIVITPRHYMVGIAVLLLTQVTSK